MTSPDDMTEFLAIADQRYTFAKESLTVSLDHVRGLMRDFPDEVKAWALLSEDVTADIAANATPESHPQAQLDSMAELFAAALLMIVKSEGRTSGE
jgi:hypothetical protein